MDMDMDIICKQTNISRKIAEKIYLKNDKDITNTICELEGYIEKPQKLPELNETQKKIKELREIVENKDKIMEGIKESSHADNKNDQEIKLK